LPIALADDVPGNRKILIRVLERLGHKVICAVSNGAELLDECSGQVDVVFIDLDIPIMDGLAAAQELSDKGIPVILISGHPDADEIVLEHEPVVTCVSKPASLKSLQSAIEQALAGVKTLLTSRHNRVSAFIDRRPGYYRQSRELDQYLMNAPAGVHSTTRYQSLRRLDRSIPATASASGHPH
jgi:CheY-like chemotaxis protein